MGIYTVELDVDTCVDIEPTNDPQDLISVEASEEQVVRAIERVAERHLPAIENELYLIVEQDAAERKMERQLDARENEQYDNLWRD